MQISSGSALVLRLFLSALAMSLMALAYSRADSAPTMASTANNFLASLYPEQREKAAFRVDDDERFNWFYTPVQRKGLPLREMTSGQRQLALALLSAGLSPRGYIKGMTIMSVDEILMVLEASGPRRDPDGYFFSIFGQPSETGVWGYRIDGHHLSQSFTVVNGKVAGAPSFFGVNPAEVQKGPRKGLRTLAREEDLGRELVQSLTDAQRNTAIVDASAPRDILTEHSRQAALTGQASGISVSALSPQQREKLRDLLDEYCENMAEDLAAFRKDQIKKAGNDLWFAWEGGIQKGEPH